MYWDDIPDPPSGLSIESGHVFRKATERLCHPPDCILKESTAEDVDRGYMFVEDDYVKLTVENPLITQLRECEVRTYLKYLYTCLYQLFDWYKYWFMY